jgi:two-component system NtrC family sensor kinase
MGEALPSLSPDALPAIPCEALVLGADAESATAIDRVLSGLGASVTPAHTPDQALALLASGAFGFLVLGEAFLADVDDIVRRARLDPRLARLPILVLAPPVEMDWMLTPPSTDRAHGRMSSLGVVLAPRRPAEVLESQLVLLVELHRTRTVARDVEDQLGQAQLDLRDAADTNAALAEQARRALSELGTAQTQLVQAAKLAALGELVAGVAHEINNPLSFSISHLSTLRRGLSRGLERQGELEPATRTESDRIEERLDGVALGLDRIKGLVVKLQTFSRLDDGKSQTVNVSDAISTVLAILHHRMRDSIQVSVEFGAPDSIYCQSSLINQCVMNLLVNAIDAIEPLEAAGSIHISARAEGEFYVLRVVDNGHGIAADIQGRIFEPFFTTKPEGKGTGLGLSIAASVVEKHDGTLELLPAEAGGTQAVIRLPLGRVAANLQPGAKAH